MEVDEMLPDQTPVQAPPATSLASGSGEHHPMFAHPQGNSPPAPDPPLTFTFATAQEARIAFGNRCVQDASTMAYEGESPLQSPDIRQFKDPRWIQIVSGFLGSF